MMIRLQAAENMPSGQININAFDFYKLGSREGEAQKIKKVKRPEISSAVFPYPKYYY